MDHRGVIVLTSTLTLSSIATVPDIPDCVNLSEVFIADQRDLKEGISNVYQYRWVS